MTSLTAMTVLVCACNLLLVFRFIQHGFVRPYWRKRGAFRWHIVPGTALTLLVPYASWHLVQLEAPPWPISIFAGTLLIMVSLSGLRLISLLKKRDTRVRRTFAGMSFAFINVGFIILSYTAWLQESTGWAPFGRVFAALALLCGLAYVYLYILEVLSTLWPIARVGPEDHQADKVPRPSLREFKALFRLNRKEDGPTILYGTVGPRVAVPIIALINVGVLIPAFIIPFHLLTHPAATLWQMSGIIAVSAAVAAFSQGLAAWATFEMTLYIRKKSGNTAIFVTTVAFLILPLVPAVLAYMCVADAGPWEALLAGLLFES